MPTIGQRIKFIRKAHDLSQVEFAQDLGVTQGFIAHIENGRNQPTADLLVKIMVGYRVDAEWLLTGEEKEDSKKNPAYLPSIGPTEKRKMKLVNAVIRVVDEGDEKKLAVLEAQMDLIDPGEKNDRGYNEKGRRVAVNGG